MITVEQYTAYFGACNVDLDISTFNISKDIATAILVDYCDAFPKTSDELSEFTESQQECITNALLLQTNQVIDNYKWYTQNGASGTISSQSVGRTSISFDNSTMNPSDRMNFIAKAMIDNCGICSRVITLVSSDIC